MITITEIHERILRGETTAREEIQAALDRAEQASGYHALLSVTPDRGLKMAKKSGHSRAFHL